MIVLQILPQFSKGGAEKIAVDLHSSYLRQSIDSHLISITGKDIPSMGNCSALGLDSPYHPLALFRLWEKIKTCGKRFDVIHCHLTPDQVVGPLAARLSGLSPWSVCTVHTTKTRLYGTRTGGVIGNLIFRQFDKLACVSVGVQSSLSDWIPSVRSRTRVIHNGIDLRRYARINVGRDGCFATGAPRIVSIGRLTKGKNQGVIISALKGLRSGGWMPGATLSFYGVGPEEGSLRRQVNECGLADSVTFQGWTDDIPSALTGADLLILPSLWEGFGLAVVEAMASGVPVLVSDVPGVREIVESDPRCLFPPLDVAALQRGIELILSSDSKFRCDLISVGRQRAQRYSLDIMAGSYLSLYCERSCNRNRFANPGMST